MKKALLLVLTLVAVSPVSTEAQLPLRMTGDEQDLAELEEIGGVYFERGFFGFGRRTRFTGNVVQYMRHNGCWANMLTAVRKTFDCRDTPDGQEKNVKILGSLIDGVFHGDYIEWNFMGGGAAHTLSGAYNSGSKCGRWRSLYISQRSEFSDRPLGNGRTTYQETFSPC